MAFYDTTAPMRADAVVEQSRLLVGVTFDRQAAQQQKAPAVYRFRLKPFDRRRLTTPGRLSDLRLGGGSGRDGGVLNAAAPPRARFSASAGRIVDRKFTSQSRIRILREY